LNYFNYFIEFLGKETKIMKKATEMEHENVLEKNKETVTTKETVTKVKKPKGKPRGGNSPVIGMNGYNLEAGDNSKILGVNIALFQMPNIDMKNVDAVAQRLSDFFALYEKADLKPTVAGMAIALNGMSRQWLWAVAHDKPLGGMGNTTSLPREVTDLIKRAYKLLENMWETYMNSGKVNPVAGIFLGKNNYGYQDKTEYVLTPNQQNDSDYDADEIRERYIAADQQKRLSDNTTISESD
jgi:hypothetical protein